jgi:hypothetical protein
LDILRHAVVPLVLVIGGEVALRAFLRLATFLKRDIWLQSRQWRSTGVKSAAIYFLLASGLLVRSLTWLWDRFQKIAELPLEQLLLTLVLMTLIPPIMLFAALRLLPIDFWLSGLSKNSRKDKLEIYIGTFWIIWRWKETVVWKWKERRWLILGTFGAFVCLVTALALPVIKNDSPLILFLLTAIFAVEQVGPSLLVEPNHEWFRRWLLTAAWVYYWGAVCIGWQYGWLGLLLISLPTLLFPVGALFLTAGPLLPFPTQELYRGKRTPRAAGSVPTFQEEILDFIDLLRYPQNKKARKEWFQQRRMALRCLLAYALGTNYPHYAVIDEKINERTEGIRTWLTGEERLLQRLDGDLFSDFLSGPGIILTGCDHAVVISSNAIFRGAQGPGIVFTDVYERPTHVIDLRVQLRTFPVEAWTKDGIAVKVVTFIPFQVGTGEAKPQLGNGFPYRSSDVFKAVHAEMMQVDLTQVPDNTKKHEWYDLPQLITEPILRDIISHYEFDELYAPFELYGDFGEHPRARISKELRDRLDAELPKFGLKRIGGGISNLVPVDERVIDQRVEAWRADWMREITLQRATGQSTRIRAVEKARTQAQIDIILDIAKRIERLRETEAPIPVDALLLYFVEILEHMLGKWTLRDLLPQDVDVIVQRLHDRVVTDKLADRQAG